MCKIDSQQEFSVGLRELKLGLCNSLEGWDWVGGEREGEEGGAHVYLRLTHADVWQRPTQCCEAIFLQFKINVWGKKIYMLFSSF